jgi:quercetin dioxygenase-like cupin family protein
MVIGINALADKQAADKPAAASVAAKAEKHDSHVTKMSELAWTDLEGYPTGCKVAGVCADGGAKSAFIKFPAGVKIASHTHPSNHWGSVVSGTGTVGWGTDVATGTDVGPGDSFHIPMNSVHWLTVKTDMVIYATQNGADGINYVNASDDPRKGAAQSK